VHGVVGIEVSQGTKALGLEAVVDPTAELVVAVHNGPDFVTRMGLGAGSHPATVARERRACGGADPAHFPLGRGQHACSGSEGHVRTSRLCRETTRRPQLRRAPSRSLLPAPVDAKLVTEISEWI